MLNEFKSFDSRQNENILGEAELRRFLKAHPGCYSPNRQEMSGLGKKGNQPGDAGIWGEPHVP